MLPDRVSNPGPLTYESGALPIALRGPAKGWLESGFVNIGTSGLLFHIFYDNIGCDVLLALTKSGCSTKTS